ncbi:MAG: FAD:protein FMN transferase, partial [Hyphomicrobiales bacterium]
MADRLQAGVERILEMINSQMSTYRPDSELSKFNATAQTSWVEVSPEVAHVMAKALDISRASSGAFDTTVAPLVNLWGFGPEKPAVYSSDDMRNRAALVKIGHRHLELKDAPAAIRKKRPDLH